MASYEDTITLLKAIKNAGFTLTAYERCIALNLDKIEALKCLAIIESEIKGCEVPEIEFLDTSWSKDRVFLVFRNYMYETAQHCDICKQSLETCVCDYIEYLDWLSDPLDNEE